MLEELRISSLGVIEESVLPLGPGFTAITGETGAGKTMVVTALGLLLGGRADAGAVRSGARAARVEGLLDLSRKPAEAVARSMSASVTAVQDAGGHVDEDRLVLSRQIAAEGRSRAHAGGASVPIATLSAVLAPLVAVHGQSDQHRLLHPTAQREALDRFAGSEVIERCEQFRERFVALRAVEDELARTRATVRERAQEADVLRFGLDEVEAVGPEEGEDVELAAEEGRLANADTLRTHAQQAREVLSADEGPDAVGALAAARQLMESVRDHDPAAGELADRLAELGYVLADLAGDVASYATSLDADPSRLAAVSERRAALVALTRKYGDTVRDVLGWAERAATRLIELDGTDERLVELSQRRDDLRAELSDLATALSAAREAAASRLEKVITAELAELAMPQARVEVSITRTPDEDGLEVRGQRVRSGPTGVDDVEFRLAANRGTDPRPLGKGASGGELSRVMLALEVALAETNPVPTFVFDEVDAGVGGRAAVEVGRRLAMLAEHAQVLVVTHLPQVAAFADQHVVVVKSQDGAVTSSGLGAVEGEARVRELSRMLAGVEESEAARAHAAELLVNAQRDRDR